MPQLVMQATRQIISSVMRRPSPSPAGRKQVSRCLFGRPDPKEQLDWINSRLAAISQEEKKRWNFDFTNDAPTPQLGDWQWEPVNICAVPAFYSPQTLMERSAIRPSTSICDENDNCVDTEKPSTSVIQKPNPVIANVIESDKLKRKTTITPKAPKVVNSRTITDYCSTRKRTYMTICDTKVVPHDAHKLPLVDTPNRPTKLRRTRLIMDAEMKNVDTATISTSSDTQL